MAAETIIYYEPDKVRIMAIANRFMPLTFGTGYFGNGHPNTEHFKTPSAPLILKSVNGNEFMVHELVTKIFFEQYLHFNNYLFERDTQKEQVLRSQPLVPNLTFEGERAACYAWIKFQQDRGKTGANEVDWHCKRIAEIFNITI